MDILEKVKKIATKTEKTEKVEKKAAIDLRKNKLSKDKAGMVIVEPVFTEKSSNLTPFNKYVFKVKNGANKNEIKKAVEGLYGVNVIGVNILKTSAKPRRIGRREAIKPGFKKAIVTLKTGENIELTKS